MSHPALKLAVAAAAAAALVVAARYTPPKVSAQALTRSGDISSEGVFFLERPIFIDHDCHAWTTIGARDFADVHTTQVVFRTERWQVPAKNQREILRDRWPAIRREARARGLTGVWLLYNDHERLASLVYFAGRSAPKDPNAPDGGALGALQGAPPLGGVLSGLPYTKVFDRTHSCPGDCALPRTR